MAFTLRAFLKRRPCVYHLTSQENLRLIRAQRRIECAARLMLSAGREELVREKRTEHVSVSIGTDRLSLRDQAPLYAANIAFAEGWSFADLIAALNGLVFFWPGNCERPNDYGMRHFERYRVEAPVVLRVDTAALFRANIGVEPLFCSYNSGSPRYSLGRPSPRGPDTFVRSSQFSGPPSKVVEMTFHGGIVLPDECSHAFDLSGPWIALTDSANDLSQVLADAIGPDLSRQ